MNDIDLLLVSGASGAVGSYLLRQILKKWPDKRVVCVFRTENSAEKLVRDVVPEAGGRVIPIIADLTQLGKLEQAISGVEAGERCLAIHCAADVSWTKTHNVIDPLNIQGTVRLANAAIRLSRGIPKFVMLSTAYADFENGAHRNAYEASKAEAERLLLQQYEGRLHTCIVRASLVVGSSTTGQIARFNGLYPLIRLIALAETPCVIADDDHLIDVVPLDWLGTELFAAIETMMDRTAPLQVTVAAGEKAISIKDVVNIAVERANEFLLQAGRPKNPVISVITRRQYDFLMNAAKTWSIDHHFENIRRISSIMDGYIRHGESGRVIHPVNTQQPAPDPPEYLPRVVDYWIAKNAARLQKTREISWMRWKEEPVRGANVH